MIKKSKIAISTLLVSLNIALIVFYFQLPLRSNSNKSIILFSPNKDSLQLLIDNFEKSLSHYEFVVNLKDQKAKNAKEIENKLNDFKQIKIGVLNVFLKPQLIKQIDNLYDTLIKEKNRLIKNNQQGIDSLLRIELKEEIKIDKNLILIQDFLSKKNGSIHFIFKGREFYFFIADLNKNDVRLHWKKDSIQKHSNLNSVIDLIKKKYKQKPLLVTNAGMFEESQKPLGLYIENNKEIISLNEKDPNDDNFYLMPNGVFFIDTANHAFIKETKDFKNEFSKKMKSIKLATQSGPMLIIDNKYHKEFKKESINNKVRNGIGVINLSKIAIGYSDNVNFYIFSQVFKDFFNCKNALFLDGAISKMYLHDLKPNELGGNFGPILSISEKKYK